MIPTGIAFMAFYVASIISAAYLYRTSVSDSSNQRMLATSVQIINNYDNYFEGALSTSGYISESYDSMDYSEVKSNMGAIFDTVRGVKGEITSLGLFSAFDWGTVSKGTLLASDSSSGSSLSTTPIYDHWFTEASSNKLINVFSKPEKVAENEYSFILSRYLKSDRITACDAILRIEFDFTKIVESISPIALGEEGSFLIYDKAYSIVYSSTEENLSSIMPALRDTVIGTSSIRLSGHSFYVYASTITNTTWRLGILMNNDAVADSIRNFTIELSVVALVLGALFLVCLFIVSNLITSPLNRLMKEMGAIESLNYQGQIETTVSGSKEAVELNRSFQELMGRIHELTETLIHDKELQRRLEMQALQNQINPHFLYNTLDSICALIDTGENEKAEEMILALSRFFRISISKGRDIIHVTDEIEHIKNYLLIQKMRFADDFSYEIDAMPGLEKFYTVKLTLQPLVENSLGHGLKEGEVTSILVKASFDSEHLFFDVSDNGYGMTPEKLKSLRDSLDDPSLREGIGVKNVYQRLRLFYGKGVRLTIDSVEGTGTSIHIVLPLEGTLSHE